MKLNDLAKLLHVSPERIKKIKKEHIFNPENQSEGGRPINYTDNDLLQLRKIILLNKCGLSSGEIREINAGEISLADQMDQKREYLENKRKQIDASLFLMIPVRTNCENLDDQFIDTVYRQALRMEDDGMKFLEPQEYTWDGYNPYVQRVTCPICHVQQKMDLEDYDAGSCSNECSMGPDLVIDIESEADSLKCGYCGSHFGVRGWIREYPHGAYNSDGLEVFTE